jgi:hypothetical protein
MGPPGSVSIFRVVYNDDHMLVAFARYWKRPWEDEKNQDGRAKSPMTFYIIIEKNTGAYIELNDMIVTFLGEKFKDVDPAKPDVAVGHCGERQA